jgi:hypothetical protein
VNITAFHIEFHIAQEIVLYGNLIALDDPMPYCIETVLGGWWGELTDSRDGKF